jgi:hypothetical protein
MSTLYSDSLVQITDESITFRKFDWKLRYRSKRVDFSEMARVEARLPSFRAGKWKLFGSGVDLHNWFPLDWHRPSRDKIFVAFLRGQGERIAFNYRLRSISFTVEDSKRVEQILREKGLLSDERPA